MVKYNFVYVNRLPVPKWVSRTYFHVMGIPFEACPLLLYVAVALHFLNKLHVVSPHFV